MKSAKIKKIGERWDFLSEADLEEFVWKNLSQLLCLKPLARQHCSDNRNRFDILGLSEDKTLSIVELKLGIDDGIVSQLTRYHESVRVQKPFAELVDHEKSICLIAIGNDFHGNSLIDAKYSQLSFRFLSYEIKDLRGRFYFQLFNYLNGKRISECQIEASEGKCQDCPPLSRMLSKLLESCNDEDAASLLEIRSRILSFDHRIQEASKQGSVALSRGKSLPIAEFKYNKEKDKTFLHLFLPFQKSRSKQVISRVKAKIWFSGQRVTDVGFIFHSRMNPITHDEWILGGKFYQEKTVVKDWIKYRIISDEEDLKEPRKRKYLLDNYNWRGAEGGLALPIEKYEQHLRLYKVLQKSATCQTLSEITELALNEFVKKARP
ncbi:hypothetical protein IQ273_08880 [Nodosilinea sp. LEGE 07298]|uniref:hypothetical protein n=1 Tax=Nodosilinea sp. LEGE 07298 TaxID=2777970 RepID=UPI0018827341|nr:hypothetical protein [Nodosilinea sp. LEGE 07298]MBE9109528.1 hypothetical protein [Nodosilinea sp. LEGE 07298]